MKTEHFKILGMFFILFGLLNCTSNTKIDYDKIFKENDILFEQNKPQLEFIVNDIENIFIKRWNREKELEIHFDSLNKQTLEQLKGIGINSIVVSKNPNDTCNVDYVISLNINKNWNIKTLRFVQLRFAPCNKFAEKYHHFYDGYHVDFWGQGDNWYIASDTDWL